MGIVAILASLLILFYFILSAVWFSRVRGKKFDQLCVEDKRRIYKLMNKGNYKKTADDFVKRIKIAFIVCSVAFVFVLIIWIAIFVHLLA